MLDLITNYIYLTIIESKFKYHLHIIDFKGKKNCENEHNSIKNNTNWPAPPTIHRGLEWPQFLNCSLSVLCLIVCKFSNFSSPHPPLL